MNTRDGLFVYAYQFDNDKLHFSQPMSFEECESSIATCESILQYIGDESTGIYPTMELYMPADMYEDLRQADAFTTIDEFIDANQKHSTEENQNINHQEPEYEIMAPIPTTAIDPNAKNYIFYYLHPEGICFSNIQVLAQVWENANYWKEYQATRGHEVAVFIEALYMPEAEYQKYISDRSPFTIEQFNEENDRYLPIGKASRSRVATNTTTNVPNIAVRSMNTSEEKKKDKTASSTPSQYIHKQSDRKYPAPSPDAIIEEDSLEESAPPKSPEEEKCDTRVKLLQLYLWNNDFWKEWLNKANEDEKEKYKNVSTILAGKQLEDRWSRMLFNTFFQESSLQKWEKIQKEAKPSERSFFSSISSALWKTTDQAQSPLTKLLQAIHDDNLEKQKSYFANLFFEDYLKNINHYTANIKKLLEDKKKNMLVSDITPVYLLKGIIELDPLPKYKEALGDLCVKILEFETNENKQSALEFDICQHYLSANNPLKAAKIWMEKAKKYFSQFNYTEAKANYDKAIDLIEAEYYSSFEPGATNSHNTPELIDTLIFCYTSISFSMIKNLSAEPNLDDIETCIQSCIKTQHFIQQSKNIANPLSVSVIPITALLSVLSESLCQKIGLTKDAGIIHALAAQVSQSLILLKKNSDFLEYLPTNSYIPFKEMIKKLMNQYALEDKPTVTTTTTTTVAESETRRSRLLRPAKNASTPTPDSSQASPDPEQFEKHFTQGKKYYQETNYSSAIDELNLAIKFNNKHHDTYAALGFCHFQLEQYQKSITYYEQAIQLNPQNENSYANIGNSYYQLKQYEKAIDFSNKAIQLNPEHFNAHVCLGHIYCQLKQYETAIDYYKKAIEIDPKGYKIYNDLGRSYFHLKQYEPAIQYYREAINLNPQFASAYHNLGVIYHYLTQFDKAIDNCMKAIDIDAKLSIAYLVLGSCYIELKQFELAISILNQSIELDSKNFITYNNLGFSYRELKQYDLAITSFKKALELDPNSAHAPLLNLGRTYYLMGKYELAEALINQSIFVDPTNSNAYASRGQLFADLKKYELAFADFDSAFKNSSPDKESRIYALRGYTYYLQSDLENARKDLDKAIELEPENPLYYQWRAWVNHREKKIHEALIDYSHAFQRSRFPQDLIGEFGSFLTADTINVITVADLPKDHQLYLIDLSRQCIHPKTEIGKYLFDNNLMWIIQSIHALFTKIYEFQAAYHPENKTDNVYPLRNLMFFPGNPHRSALYDAKSFCYDLGEKLGELDPSTHTSGPKFHNEF